MAKIILSAHNRMINTGCWFLIVEAYLTVPCWELSWVLEKQQCFCWVSVLVQNKALLASGCWCRQSLVDLWHAAQPGKPSSAESLHCRGRAWPNTTGLPRDGAGDIVPSQLQPHHGGSCLSIFSYASFLWKLSLFIFPWNRTAHIISAALRRQLMWRSCCSTQWNPAASAGPPVRELPIWKKKFMLFPRLCSLAVIEERESNLPPKQPGFLPCLLQLVLPNLEAAGRRRDGGNGFPTGHWVHSTDV